MNTILSVVTSIILLIPSGLFGQDHYKAGFKIIRTYDSTRIYKPNSVISDKLHYRPIDIDLWYPAEITSSDTTASFVDFVNLLEQRSTFYDDTGDYQGITEELLQYICAGFNCVDYNILKKVKTGSYVNSKPVVEKFPLIIYLAGFNGMGYENYVLFESLAKKGFVVASVSSIGKYPGNMTMDTVDLFEQINDAKFIMQYLPDLDFVSETVGLVGYSWGGLASFILSMRSPRIKAVVSLDGSEQFSYGNNGEDEKLNLIRRSVFFKPEDIRSSYLYLDRDAGEWENSPDSIYNITDFIKGDKDYLKINQATHEDFSSLSAIANDDQANPEYDLICRLTINYFLDKLKGEHVFYQNIPHDKVSKQFLQRKGNAESGKHQNVIKGIIRDQKSNAPMPFVNVGILNKDKGTITNGDGVFELKIAEINENDTMRISMIGYEPMIVSIKHLLEKPWMNLNIHLEEETTELNEVVIAEKKFRTKVFGNKTHSKFFGGKFAADDLGSEIAIKINIKEAPTYLEEFNFNVSYNTEDTAIFRVNIYEIKNGMPDKNVLTENIFLSIGNKTGTVKLDLTAYNIVVDDDFFVSLEWIGGNQNSGIVFSAGFINKGTYYRKASQGRWTKYPMGVGFNVTGKY